MLFESVKSLSATARPACDSEAHELADVFLYVIHMANILGLISVQWSVKKKKSTSRSSFNRDDLVLRMDFDALVEERHKVQDLCRKHVLSLAAFKSRSGASFRVLPEESEPREAKLHHLTSTATCIESLWDCHQMFWPERAFEKFGDGKEQVLERLRRISIRERLSGT